MSQKEMLFRCSAVGNLMSDSKAKLSEKQLIELDRLAGLRSAGKLTVKQTQTLADFESRKNAPVELSISAQSYVDEFIFEYKYRRVEEFSTNATDKGTKTEDDGIHVLNMAMKTRYKKNTERFNGDYLTGEPDIIGKDMILDIKSNYTWKSFLKKKSIDSIYKWQLAGYCQLLNKRKGAIAYTLNNTPLETIRSEITKRYYKNGLVDLTDEDKAKIALNHIYTDKHIVDGNYVNGFWDYAKDYLGIFEDVQVPFIEVPIEKRLRYFEVEFTDEDFEKLDTQIEKAVKYIETNYPLI